MKIASALLLACAAACAPVVTHSPRIEQGFTLYGTAGGGGRLCGDETCETELTPQQGAGIRYGRAATASSPGFSAGLTLSTFIISSELDLYVQAPTSMSSLDMGAGLLAGGMHGMPYVQVGRMRPDGSGWYTTQGFAYLAPRPARMILMPDGPGEHDDVEPRYWAPTVAYRTRGQYGVHFYVTGAFGRATATKYDSVGPGTRKERQPVQSVMMGVVFDFQPVPAERYRTPPPPGPVPAVPPPPVGRPR